MTNTNHKDYIVFSAMYESEFISQKTGRIYRVFVSSPYGKKIYIPSEYAAGQYEEGDEVYISASCLTNKEGEGFFAFRVKD